MVSPSPAPLLVLLLSTPLVTCYVLDLPNSLSLLITVDPDPVTNQCQCYYQDLYLSVKPTWKS